MPLAVQGLFANSAAFSSAPAVKPSSPQVSESGGIGGFQSALDQAQPKNASADKASDSDGGNDSKIESTKSHKKTRGSDHASKPHARVQKQAAPKADEADDQEDPAAADLSKKTVPATPDVQPGATELPKAEEGSPKAGEKKKTDAAVTDDAELRQAQLNDPTRKVQAIKPQEHRQPESRKQTKNASVQAIAPADGKPAGEDSTAAAAASAPQAAAPNATASNAGPSSTGKQRLAIQPISKDAQSSSSATPDPSAVQDQLPAVASDGDTSAGAADDTAAVTEDAKGLGAKTDTHTAAGTFSDVLNALQSPAAARAHASAGAIASNPADGNSAPPEAQFAQVNHPQIVTGLHGQLLPTGGNMQIRLDPPELGALSVIVRVHEGVMSASFETSNDQATRLLSHSLNQLKTSLEAQGVTVGKLHVQQSPRDQQSSSRGDERQSQDDSPQDNPAQREQQRREMLRRMWRRLSGGNDPLDLVA